jgi:cysteine desulfurase family protein (TIGR01976 family)
MRLDVAGVRAHFPALAAGAAHFDGPGGSQTPDVVARAVHDALVSPIANRGSVTRAEQHAETIVQAGRSAMADLLGADPAGIVFGRSMTQLTFDVARALAKTWTAGDEIVVSRLDHDANVRPWVLLAEQAGATVRWIDFDPESTELTARDVGEQLRGRTRLVAVTGASNLLGSRPDLPAIAAEVHRAGALLYVDGVHLTAHAGIDIAALGADFFACSPYKFFGPHCGVLAADPQLLADLHPDKLLPSSDAVPERFEFGTLPYELLAGTTAAVDFIAGLAGGAGPAGGTGLAGGAGDRRQRILTSMRVAGEHEDRLRHRIEQRLAELESVTVRSRAAERTPTLLVTFAGRAGDPLAPLLARSSLRCSLAAADAYRFLAELDVNAPAGSFYAYEAARRLGLPDGGLRIGLAPYTDDSDVDRLLDGLTKFVESGR